MKKEKNVLSEDNSQNADNQGNIVNDSQENIVNAGKKDTKTQIIQFLKFLGFSLSAGVIQLLSFTILYELTGWLDWWPSHLISVTLSVVWNFTFNRKFTFKSASNVPLAMVLVIIYYACYIPASVFGGNALKAIGWDGFLVEVLMMVINFITEFFWDKYIVFNDKLLAKVLKKKVADTQNSEQDHSEEHMQNSSNEEVMQSAVSEEVTLDTAIKPIENNDDK